MMDKKSAPAGAGARRADTAKQDTVYVHLYDTAQLGGCQICSAARSVYINFARAHRAELLQADIADLKASFHSICCSLAEKGKLVGREWLDAYEEAELLMAIIEQRELWSSRLRGPGGLAI